MFDAFAGCSLRFEVNILMFALAHGAGAHHLSQAWIGYIPLPGPNG